MNNADREFIENLDIPEYKVEQILDFINKLEREIEGLKSGIFEVMNRNNDEIIVLNRQIESLKKENEKYRFGMVENSELRLKISTYTDIEKREKILMETVVKYQYQVEKLKKELKDVKEQLDIESNFHDSMQENLVNQHIKKEKELQTKIQFYQEAIDPIAKFFKNNSLGTGWSIRSGAGEISVESLLKLVEIIKNCNE